MNHHDRVMVHMGLSAKRDLYLENWLEAREAGGDAAYWAARIERVNDAAIAFDRLMWAEGRAR